MSDEMKVGNPNEVVNNYSGILQANEGALQGAMKDIQGGKMPSANGAGGGDLNILSEMATAKAGVAGSAMELLGEMSGAKAKGGGSLDSALFGGSKGKGRGNTKKDVAFRQTVQLALTNYHPVIGKPDRATNLAAWKTVRKELAKTYPSMDELRRNPEKFGLGEIKKNIDAATVGKANPADHEVIMGADKGNEDAKERIKSLNVDKVLDAAEKMSAEKQDVIAKQIAPQKPPAPKAAFQPPAPSWAKLPHEKSKEGSDKAN